MKNLYIVQIQGWGDDENAFYNMGAFSTLAGAEAKLEQLLVEWEEGGCDRDDVVYEIEELAVA